MFETEVKKGERFEFGKNWQSFLSTLTDERIGVAIDSIKEMLQIDDLNGKKVLDVASAVLLAAHRGNSEPHSGAVQFRGEPCVCLQVHQG